MGIIQIESRGFTGDFANINGVSNHNVSLFSVIRAIVTVGAKGRLDLIQSGWRHISRRTLAGIANALLLNVQDGNMALTADYNDIDLSEKGNASYWLGTAFTKLTAEIKLSVRWLIHVDRLKRERILTIQGGTNERGDLAGMDRDGYWHVLEAKGRSNKIETKLRGYAKRQATRIVTINGTVPKTSSASIVSLFRNPISIELLDPFEEEEHKIKMRIEKAGLYNEYYKPFVNHLKKKVSIEIRYGDKIFTMAKTILFEKRIWVGILKEILTNPSNAFEAVKGLVINEEDTGNKKEVDYSLGLDGVLFARSLDYFD